MSDNNFTSTYPNPPPTINLLVLLIPDRRRSATIYSLLREGGEILAKNRNYEPSRLTMTLRRRTNA